MNNLRPLFLLAAAVLISSCSLFHREPPLPRRALIEASGSEQEFASLIQDADIIYFPSEAASLAARSDPAWKILAALRLSGDSFAVGYDWTGKDAGRRDYLNEASKSGAQTLRLNEPASREQGEESPVTDQVAADRIASWFREHRRDKLLVFVRRERLALAQGIPHLVAQQTKARQLILNPRKSATGARLLARN